MPRPTGVCVGSVVGVWSVCGSRWDSVCWRTISWLSGPPASEKPPMDKMERLARTQLKSGTISEDRGRGRNNTVKRVLETDAVSRRGHDVHDLRCRTRGSGHALARGLHNIHLARRAILRERTNGLDRWISLGRDKLVRHHQDDDSGQLDKRRRLARREQH